jgi:hypothetical protein
VIAATSVVFYSFEPIEEEFIAVTEVEKCAVMHPELNATLRPDGASGITVVPCQSNKCAEVWNNDIGQGKMPVDERYRSGVNEVVV